MNYTNEQLRQALQHHFKYDAFREGQQEIVRALLEGKDVMAILSTGAGKSATFQLPAAISGKTFVVVCPLLSLADDQLDDLTNRHIVGRKYNSSLSEAAKVTLCKELLSTPVHLLYVTPESFQHVEFLSLLKALHEQHQLGALIVDEVHTVEEWGKDFRKSFLQLGLFRQAFPTLPMAAFTATADRNGRNSICTILGMHPVGSPKRVDVLLPFNRPNITPIFVENADMLPDMKQWIERIAASQGGRLPTCIAYCSSQAKCKDFSDAFAKLFPEMNPAPYHAGMSMADRTTTAAHWKYPWIITTTEPVLKTEDKTHHILFATTAFGMGINKGDVRLVFQLGPARNVNATMQQMGRGGRDNQQAYYILYVDFNDINTYHRFNSIDLKEGKITVERHAEVKNQLDQMRTIMRNRKNARCRRAEIIGCLNGNEAIGLKCDPKYTLCDVCSPTPYLVVEKEKDDDKKKKKKSKVTKRIKKGKQC